MTRELRYSDLIKRLKIFRICGSGRLATRRMSGIWMHRRAFESRRIMEDWIKRLSHSSRPSTMISLGHCFATVASTSSYALSGAGWRVSVFECLKICRVNLDCGFNVRSSRWDGNCELICDRRNQTFLVIS